MIGRGTRLCPDLFGPGDDKTAFNVFDFCQNLEYFSEAFVPADKTGAPPLREQIFKARLDLIEQLDALKTHGEERTEIAEVLREALASMNEQNFLVRPHVRLVEQFREPAAWESVSLSELAALRERVASLPDQLDPEQEDSNRFDILVLNAQLSLLRGEPYERQRKRVMQIAGLLEDQQTIPFIAEQLEPILDVRTDEWWVDVTYPMLEEVRKRLRLLVPLIERAKKGQIFTDIEDEIGDGTTVVVVPPIEDDPGFAQFRTKAQHFLKEHLAEEAVAKVRSGQPVTADDIAELQRILVAAGIGDGETFAAASERVGSFGLFIRSLVGLDRAAAKEAFNDFLDEKNYSKNQITFVNLIIDYLTDHGVVKPGRVYESPFTGVAPQGPDDLFGPNEVERLFDLMEGLTSAAG